MLEQGRIHCYLGAVVDKASLVFGQEQWSKNRPKKCGRPANRPTQQVNEHATENDLVLYWYIKSVVNKTFNLS